MTRTYLTAPLNVTATPGQNLGALYASIRDGYDLGGQQATVTVPDGAYPSCVFDGPLVGAKSPASCLFVGNVTNPYRVAIGNGGDSLTVTDGAKVQVKGIGFVGGQPDGSGAQRNMVVTGAEIFIGNAWFNACSLAQVDAAGGGNVVSFGPLVMLAGAPYAFLCEQQAVMLLRSNLIQWGGATPSYQAGFYVDQGSLIDLTGTTWAGSFAGKQYDGGGFGMISANGAGPSFIPGSIPGGFTYPPGWYF